MADTYSDIYGETMTIFDAEQLANAKMLAWMAAEYLPPKLPASTRRPYRLQFAVVNAAFTEASCRNLHFGDAESSSLGFFQQTKLYGSMADRLNPIKALDMFMNGGPDGQAAFLSTTWKTGTYGTLCLQIQKVQKSQYDGWTIDPNTGKPYVLAGNYIGNIALTIELLSKVGVPEGQTSRADRIAEAKAQLDGLLL